MSEANCADGAGGPRFRQSYGNYSRLAIKAMTGNFVRRAISMVLPACVTFAGAITAMAEPIVREERAVTINGVKEIWQLVWNEPPATVCGPEDVSMAITCPCSGWAYGEYGKLSLVRKRDGSEIERMDLRPLFGKFDDPGDQVAGSAYLQRWPMQDRDMDRDDKHDPELTEEIKRRPAPVIMNLADYDRNGAATEFLVQVGTLPCGKHQFAAIGLSTSGGQLRALSSAAHPDAPLMMPLAAWQALLRGAGPSVIETTSCGDHGSETRGDLVVSAGHGVIRVKSREFSCAARGKPSKLIEQADE